MMKTIIDNAVNGCYTDFSATIKAELKSKLAGNEDIVNYTKEMDRYSTLKDQFKEISSPEA